MARGVACLLLLVCCTWGRIVVHPVFPFSFSVEHVANSKVALRFALDLFQNTSLCNQRKQCMHCNATHCVTPFETVLVKTLRATVTLTGFNGFRITRTFVPTPALQHCDFPISLNVFGVMDSVPLGGFLQANVEITGVVEGQRVSVSLVIGDSGPLPFRTFMAETPTLVRHTVDKGGIVTVLWKWPPLQRAGIVPVHLYRVESFPGTTVTCIAPASSGNCTYTTPFVGGGHRFVVTALTLLGPTPTSDPTDPIATASNAPTVVVDGDLVLVSWSPTNDSVVVSVVPAIVESCIPTAPTSCTMPSRAFDPTKTYQFQAVSMRDNVVVAVSPFSTPTNLSQSASISVGAIVGIAVAGTLVLAAAVAAIYLLHRKWTSGSFHRPLDDNTSSLYYKF